LKVDRERLTILRLLGSELQVVGKRLIRVRGQLILKYSPVHHDQLSGGAGDQEH